MTTTQVKTGTTGVQTPTPDNVQTVLKQLKEVVEVGQRLRGDPMNSFVRVADLVNNNMARLVNGQLKPPASTNGGSSGGSGTVTSIIAGTGLSGGTITVSGTIALANTAVTPGSYINANITVDAQGRLTAATSGSGGGAMVNISTITLSSAASNVTFSSIPGTYKSLKLIGIFSGSASAPNFLMNLNGDSGSHYTCMISYGQGTGGQGVNNSAGQTSFISTIVSTTTGSPTSLDLTFAGYAGTTFTKQIIGNWMRFDAGSTYFGGTWNAYWNQTSAITSIVMTMSSGNFVAGTTFTLYGLN